MPSVAIVDEKMPYQWVKSVVNKLKKEGVIDKREKRAINQAARESGIGKPGQTEGYRKILDAMLSVKAEAV